MARRRYGISAVTVSTSFYDEETGIETDIEVDCAVTPGERERGPSYWSAGEPGCPPEVEILSAKSENGEDWQERIESDRSWVAEIEDRAITMAGEYDGPDTTREARGE